MATPDPRDYVAPTRIGTPLRDGAVTPAPADFLGPVNAGKAGEAGNPHGPNVYNPELHGSQGIRPVAPGPVSAASATQDTAEKTHAASFQPDTEAPEQG